MFLSYMFIYKPNAKTVKHSSTLSICSCTELTSDSDWVVTSAREDQEIYPDYAEKFSHTFPDLVCVVLNLVEWQIWHKCYCDTYDFMCWSRCLPMHTSSSNRSVPKTGNVVKIQFVP